MRSLRLPLALAVSALAAACAGPAPLTGAAAARSRGAAMGDVGEPRRVPRPADPWFDDARVLAKANGKVITLREIQHELGPTYYQSLDQRDLLDLLVKNETRKLVLRRLVVDEMVRLGYRPSEREMEADLRENEKEAAAKGTTIEQHLLDNDLTRREWDEKRRETMCYEFAKEYFSGLFPDRWYFEEHFRPSVDAWVGPEEIRRWGGAHRRATETGGTVTLRVIDLRWANYIEEAGGSESGARRLCEAARSEVDRRLAAGEPFEAVARALSQGMSAERGGLLGTLDRDTPHFPKYVDWAFAEGRRTGDLSPWMTNPVGIEILCIEAVDPTRSVSIEEWAPPVRRQLEVLRRELAWHEAQLRLLEESVVSPPEFRESLLMSLREDARKLRERLAQ